MFPGRVQLAQNGNGAVVQGHRAHFLRFGIGSRDAPHFIYLVDILPPGRQRLVQPGAGGQQEECDLADGAILVGMEYLQQPLQLLLVQGPFDFIAFVVELDARQRRSVQKLPFHGQIEGSAHELQVLVTRGRGQPFRANRCVKRLHPMAQGQFECTSGSMHPAKYSRYRTPSLKQRHQYHWMTDM